MALGVTVFCFFNMTQRRNSMETKEKKSSSEKRLQIESLLTQCLKTIYF